MFNLIGRHAVAHVRPAVERSQRCKKPGGWYVQRVQCEWTHQWHPVAHPESGSRRMHGAVPEPRHAPEIRSVVEPEKDVDKACRIHEWASAATQLGVVVRAVDDPLHFIHVRLPVNLGVCSRGGVRQAEGQHHDHHTATVHEHARRCGEARARCKGKRWLREDAQQASERWTLSARASWRWRWRRRRRRGTLRPCLQGTKLITARLTTTSPSKMRRDTQMVADGSSKIHFMNPTGSATAPPSPPLTAASDLALGGAIAVSKSHWVFVHTSAPTHTHTQPKTVPGHAPPQFLNPATVCSNPHGTHTLTGRWDGGGRDRLVIYACVVQTLGTSMMSPIRIRENMYIS
jgi:hypothetical protein